jgi:TrbB protein
MTHSKLSAFSARIDHGVLNISHLVDDQPHTIALIELASPIALIQQGETVRCRIQGGPDHLISAPQGTDAAEMLTKIAIALDQHKMRRKLTRLSVIVTAVVCLSLVVSSGIAAYLQFDQVSGNRSALLSQQLSSLPLAATTSIGSSARPVITPMRPATATAIATGPTPVTSAVDTDEADGWSLPASVRTELASNLRKAADRGAFSVEYSTDHERTLYVFADPQCPNCQRLESVLNKVAGFYNVVVFPVAIVGKEKSIASITPVLCLPPEQRKAAWDALFDLAGDVMNLGKPVQAQTAASDATDSAKCDVAGKALGVNEVAFKTYGIPGTPWIISDDGRHVPQAVLQDPVELQSFLSAAEVTHGAR